MSVSGVSSYDQLYDLYGIYGIQGIQGIGSSQETSTSDSSSIQTGGDQANFSGIGRMMGQLCQLQASNPSLFKETAQKISDDLATQAKDSSDSGQSTMLSDLSGKFAEAAQTGTMDSLQPSLQQSGDVYGSKGYGRASRRHGGEGMGDAGSIISQDLSAVSSNASTSSSSTGTSSADPMQLMDQLQQLATSDPAKFKEVTQKISDDLAAKAKSSTDSGESSMLSDLSDKFAEAAQSGTMDSLQPPQGPPPMAFGSADGSSSQDSGDSSATSQQYDFLAQLEKIMSQDLSGSLSDMLLSSVSGTGAAASVS